MDNNVERIADYFKAGEKRKCVATGVEIEHFVVGKDGNSMSYGQMAAFMEKIKKQTDKAYFEDGHLLGFYNEDYSITLEPASQLEISIAPKEKIEEIEQVYQSFRREADKILSEEGFFLVNEGYHPYKKATELELIPKKRYEYMNCYFEQSGKLGKNMMRATASTQVSIDYESEQDFVEKYRLACILSPVLALLTDNTLVFEGEKVKKHMMRTAIWLDTDSVRCGIFPGTFSEDFGYEKYAQYLYENPPILIMNEKGEAVYTGQKKLEEIYGKRAMTKKEIEHAISMFFPDVRLKNYIEIRMADSMEIASVLAYTALIKACFYQSSIRKQLNAYLGAVTEKEIDQAKLSLMENGYDGQVYGKSVREVLGKLVELLEKYGDMETKQYVIGSTLFEKTTKAGRNEAENGK